MESEGNALNSTFSMEEEHDGDNGLSKEESEDHAMKFTVENLNDDVVSKRFAIGDVTKMEDENEEEHDLDDLIKKRFTIKNVTKEEIKDNLPLVNSSVEATDTQSDLSIRDTLETKEKTVALIKNGTIPNSLEGISDDDFDHEITLKTVDNASNKSVSDISTVAEDEFGSSAVEYNDSLESGSGESGDEAFNSGDQLSQFFGLTDTPVAVPEIQPEIEPEVKKQNVNLKAMNDDEIQALSVLNKIIDPQHAYTRNSVRPNCRDRRRPSAASSTPKAGRSVINGGVGPVGGAPKRNRGAFNSNQAPAFGIACPVASGTIASSARQSPALRSR